MRKVIRKWFWIWDFDKEEKWLNEMAAQGLALVSVGWCRYEFETCNPGEYNIRLELLEHAPRHEESQRYITFLEETGVEHIGSYLRWAYFRKKTTEGAFDLFSDIQSRITHLKRIQWLSAIMCALNFWVGLYNVFLFFTFGIGVNFLGLINIAIGILCLFGIAELRRKRHKLEKDRQVFE